MAKRARAEADWDEIAEIGARLRAARLAAGLSQTALAARLNQGAAYQSSVAAAQRAVWDSQGSQQFTGALVCKVANVTRFAVGP